MTRECERLKLIISYDGTPFAGWQSQATGNGIQDHLEAALAQLCGRPPRVHGAGRTDSGVHALAQCAHVDVPAAKYKPARWANGLNALLPAEIRIERCEIAPRDFHSRFDALGKIYRYRIWNADVLSPFERTRAWHVTAAIDYAVLVEAARAFIGRHDFSAFTANRGHPVEDAVRNIRHVKARRRGALITMEFSGDGFLYKMVRLIVGSLVRCATGEDDVATITDRLADCRRSGRREVAPAAGLYLVKVLY